MPKTLRKKNKLIISKKNTRNNKIKSRKNRITIRGKNNNRLSVYRKSSISRKSVNKRNISRRKRTKKNMKGGGRKFQPLGEALSGKLMGKSPAGKKTSRHAARTESITPSQIADTRRKNRQEILNEIITRLSSLGKDKARIPIETAERLSIPKEGEYTIDRLKMFKEELPTFDPQPVSRSGLASGTPDRRRISTHTSRGKTYLVQRPYTYYINIDSIEQTFQTDAIQIMVKRPKKKTQKLVENSPTPSLGGLTNTLFENSRAIAFKTLAILATQSSKQTQIDISQRFMDSNSSRAMTQEEIYSLRPLKFEDLFKPDTSRTWIEPLYECLCYNFGNKVSGRTVAAFDYSYEGKHFKLNFNRVLLLQKVANNEQCYRTMSSQNYGEHPQPFNRNSICQDGVNVESDSCWYNMGTPVVYKNATYDQYKFRNKDIPVENNPYSQCWLCGEDLVCNVLLEGCQKPPQCEHKFAVMEGILLTTIPNVWNVDQSGGHFFGDHGYAPSCGFCNETKSNIIMSSPERIPYAETQFGPIYKYVWIPNGTNIEILFNNYIDMYIAKKIGKDIDREIQFVNNQWNPDWNDRCKKVWYEINTILENSLNNSVWLKSVYYNTGFYSHKIYCEFSYTLEPQATAIIYINPFQLLAHVINRQCMGYTNESNNMYVIFHAFLSSYVNKTPVVLQLNKDTKQLTYTDGSSINLYYNLNVSPITRDIRIPSMVSIPQVGTIEVIEIDGTFDDGYFTIPQINPIPINVY